MWHETGHRAEVTCIQRSPRKDTFAVGYADGSIRLWNSLNGSVTTTLNGHKKSVTALAFDSTGTRLASGSQDTDLIIWDVVAEAGLHRCVYRSLSGGDLISFSLSLRGHRDQITAIKFIAENSFAGPSSSTTSSPGFILTGSKDTFMKLWDLSTQHCIQTVVAHRSEVWTLDVDREQKLVFTGSSEGELKAWRIDADALSGGLKEAENGEVCY